MILETRHTGIVVKNMEKCLRFWRDIMGLDVVGDFWEQGEFIDTVQNLKGVKLHMIKLKAPDGTLIELLKDDTHPTPSPERNTLCDRGIRHIAFTVADIDESWRILRENGCEELSKVVTAPDGKARLFFARDPEGNLLEMVQIVPKIETSYRRIISEIPHPKSLTLIQELEKVEPRSMSGPPPIVWDKAEGFQVWDAFGNRWIDFTSGILLANAGHAPPGIKRAIIDQLDRKLWYNYCNPSEIRLSTIKAIMEILPPYLNKVFLLTTGSEAVECAVKLMRLHGRKFDPKKIHILSYYNSFHGRTMAAQAAGGFMEQQEWMGIKPFGFHHIPFPDCSRCPWDKPGYDNCGQECLERGLETIRSRNLDEDLFAGVITETFQGPFVSFIPEDYTRALRDWANRHTALLVFDEIQAGFGRTGKWFGFEHYGVEPDLICLGKGMTSCLPMSAVAGRSEILDLPGHGEMSSTHTGNPLCCAATIANIKAIREGGLMENARANGDVVTQAFEDIRHKYPEYIGTINGKGLVWGLNLLIPDGKQPNVDLANKITDRCFELGLLMLRMSRGILKIAPPLCINREALLEGLGVIEDSLADSIEEDKRP